MGLFEEMQRGGAVNSHLISEGQITFFQFGKIMNVLLFGEACTSYTSFFPLA